MSDVLLVTGMSGAGRSTVSAALEDLGWFVIDNLPLELIVRVGELASAGSHGRTPASPSSSDVPEASQPDALLGGEARARSRCTRTRRSYSSTPPTTS